MIIKNLKLENFRNIIDQEIDFDSKTNVLSSGTENGQGKSTFCFALFLLYYNSIQGKLEDYINWNADYFFIKSQALLDDGTNIDIEIKYSQKNKTERKLIIDGIDEPYINSDAVKKLDELLNSNIALTSSIFLQGSNDIVHVRPAERREFLKNIYDLKFEDTIKEIENDIKSLKEIDLKEAENKIYSLENKEYIFKEEKNIDSSKLKDFQLNEKNIELELKDKELQLNVQDNEKKEFKQVLEKIDKLNVRINYNEDNLEVNEKALKDKVSLQKDLNNYKDQLENLSDIKIKEIEKEINILPSLKRIKVYDENDWIKAQKDFQEIVIKIQYEKDNYEKIKSGICSVCHSKFESKDLEKREYFIKTLEDDKIVIADLLRLEADKKTQYNQDKKENDELKQKKTLLNNNLEKEKEIYNQKKKNLENLINKEKENIEKREKALEDLINNFKKNITFDQQELLELTTKKIELEENQKGIDLNLENTIANLKKELEIVKEKIKELEKIKIIAEEIKKYNKEIKEQEKIDKFNLNNYYKEKDNLLLKLNKLERTKNIYKKEFPNYVLSKTIFKIENKMNNFLDETYKGRYKIKIEEKRDSIYIYYGPKKSDINSASGYEQQIISSAYKDALINLGSVNYPFILDEADGFATEKNSTIFYDYLCNKYRDKQIIMITQKEETKNYIVNNFGAKYFEIKDGKIVNEI